MALRVALVLDGNAQGARSALQQTTTDVDKLTAATVQQTAAAQANVAANTRAAQSNANVANLAAQFQDIGVTAAMGMSPLQIALQQGTQISAVLGQQGAAGAAKMLLGAVTAILNPVSLVTIAVVGFGAAALQAFGSMLSGADKATMSLEEHDKWLKEILTGYDSAAKAAKAASEEAQKLPQGAVVSNLEAEIAKTDAALKTQYGTIAELRQEMQDYAEAAAAAFDLGIPAEVTAQLTSMSGVLGKLTEDGRLSAAETDQLVVELTKLKNTTADENLRRIASEALGVVGAFDDLIAKAASLQAGLSNVQVPSFRGLGVADAIEQIKRLTPDLRTASEQVNDLFTLNAPEAQTTSELKALTDTVAEFNKQTAAQEAQKKAQEAARKAASAANRVPEFDRSIEQSREKTAATQLEIAMIGQSTVAAEKARKILELETAAKKDAIGLSPARVAAIQAEADASAQAAAELENTKGVWSEIQQAGQTAMDSILDSVLSGGKNIGDVLTNIAQQYLKLVIQMSVTNPLQNALLGTSSPTFGSNPIASFITGLFGKREFGGPVVAGRPYIVGEKRPEIFVPTSSGTIIPNTSMMGGAGGGMRFNQTIINNSQERVQSRQRQRADGSVYQELVIGATQRGMEKGQYRGFGIQSPTKSR
jgi:hypothetical protein